MQGSSITTCTDITFHSVNSGWAGFEIKKQWSRNLADFIIIINKLSNLSSVQQQQKKKSGQKKPQTNQELNGFKQTNKQESFTKRSVKYATRHPLLGATGRLGCPVQRDGG